MNWKTIEIDLAIFNTEQDFQAEEKNTALEMDEYLSPELADFFSRESALAASVGDLSGVTARPNKGWRLATQSEAVLELR